MEKNQGGVIVVLLSQDEISNACNWLLENAGPSIRYRTLIEILHLNFDNFEVRKAYNEILNFKRLLKTFLI